MRFHEDQKGFTLVELVIVAAIVSIMAALSLTMLARIKYTNTEKMVTYVTDSFSKIQILAMSKETPRYLHVYRLDGDYYVCINESATSTAGKNGTSLGSNVKVYKVVGAGGSDELITDSVHAVISYKKDGTIREGDALEDIRKIVVSGSYTVEIRINHKTGRIVTEKR